MKTCLVKICSPDGAKSTVTRLRRATTTDRDSISDRAGRQTAIQQLRSMRNALPHNPNSGEQENEFRRSGAERDV